MKQATPTRPQTKEQNRTRRGEPDQALARNHAAAVAALRQRAIRDSARLIRTSEPGLKGMEKLVRYHRMLQTASRTDQTAIIIEELAYWYKTVQRSRAISPPPGGQQMESHPAAPQKDSSPQEDSPPEQQAKRKHGKVGSAIQRIRQTLRRDKRA